MSTNAKIVKKVGNRATSIYLHWDGYPGHVLPILRESFSDESKLDALLALGDLSVLGNKLAPSDPAQPHGFYPDKPQPDTCLFYERDRGEHSPAVKSTIFDYSQRQYNYIWENGQWSWKVGKKYK